MAQQKIQLRKLRDFSQNISDTFQFIKQELKPLLTAFVLVAGAFMLVSVILSGIYQKEAFGFLDQIQSGGLTSRNVFSFYTPGYFLSLLFSLVAFGAMITVIALYMKLSDENAESPTAADIWRLFGKYFFRIAIFSVLEGILVFVGFIFCLLPGIYFMVVLLPYPFIIVNEDKSIGQTFNRCFELIKENFWNSLGIYIVAGLISSVCSMVIGLVLGIFIGVGSYFSTKEISSTAAIVTSFITILQYFFYLVMFVAIGLQYYNLAELRDGTGLEKRLEGLGSGHNSGTGNEEQY